MAQNTSSGVLPMDFPPELAATAFIAGEEAAWRPLDALVSVRWFGEHGYALLGTELWLLQDGRIQSLPRGLSGLGEAHGNTVDRKENEAWHAFARRSADETAAYLERFNPADIVEKGDLHFQVCWISENDFDDLIHRRGRYKMLSSLD